MAALFALKRHEGRQATIRPLANIWDRLKRLSVSTAVVEVVVVVETLTGGTEDEIVMKAEPPLVVMTELLLEGTGMIEAPLRHGTTTEVVVTAVAVAAATGTIVALLLEMTLAIGVVEVRGGTHTVMTDVMTAVTTTVEAGSTEMIGADRHSGMTGARWIEDRHQSVEAEEALAEEAVAAAGMARRQTDTSVTEILLIGCGL